MRLKKQAWSRSEIEREVVVSLGFLACIMDSYLNWIEAMDRYMFDDTSANKRVAVLVVLVQTLPDKQHIWAPLPRSQHLLEVLWGKVIGVHEQMKNQVEIQCVCGWVDLLEDPRVVGVWKGPDLRRTC